MTGIPDGLMDAEALVMSLMEAVEEGAALSLNGHSYVPGLPVYPHPDFTPAALDAVLAVIRSGYAAATSTTDTEARAAAHSLGDALVELDLDTVRAAHTLLSAAVELFADIRALRESPDGQEPA